MILARSRNSLMLSGKRFRSCGRYFITPLAAISNKHITTSAGALALVLFFCMTSDGRASMALTETIGTVPEGKIDISFREEYFSHEDGFRRETMGAGFGILPRLTIGYYLQYLHRDGISSGENEIGDSFLRIWFYLGDYLDNTLHAGLLCNFRIPTGPNAYSDPRWRNLALGNNELKLGPVIQWDAGSVFLHFNVFYVFRERDKEGFYNAVYLNPLERETYRKVFGLNFLSDNTFLEGKRLKNDYAVFSIAINTDRIYPLIPYVEFYASHRVYRQKNDPDTFPVEGAGVNPVLVSAGCRYFFSESTFAGIYYIVNPVGGKGYLRQVAGLDAALQF